MPDDVALDKEGGEVKTAPVAKPKTLAALRAENDVLLSRIRAIGVGGVLMGLFICVVCCIVYDKSAYFSATLAALSATLTQFINKRSDE